MSLTVGTAVQGTGSRVLCLDPHGELVENALRLADLQRPLEAVVADSRQVSPDVLFVALPGERTDGHAFLAQAFEGGARAVLVRETTDRRLLESLLRGGGQRYAFLVPEPLTALQSLARFWRGAHGADVIGVTGSIGKTTTKEILASVLAVRGPILKSEANLNTEIGLPLMLLRLATHHRTAVLEMGMYASGDIELLARIARPTIGIVTNVEPIHLERLGTIERIARAKSELVAALPPDGLAILNGDNPWTRAMAATTGVARTVLVGIGEACDYRAEEIHAHGLEGLSFRLRAPEAVLEIRSRIPGRHTVHALLAAAAAARELGLPWERVREGLEGAEMTVRQRRIRTRDDLLLIDDAYNAAPLSMRAALELLEASPGEKIAVLGDMLELGPDEVDAHHQVGAWAAETVDWLVARGPRAAWIADAALRRGLSPTRIVRAETNAAAAEAVRHIVGAAIPMTASTGRPTISSELDKTREPRWTVLVKGSRGMAMEEIVDSLRGSL